MICALTVRQLKPGTSEEFRAAFMGGMDTDSPPPGWVRFNMVRGVSNPDEVICFGFFDGTLDELRASEPEGSREAQTAAIAPFVESVGADGLYEVVEEFVA
jgi:heme-degrading monooxygenase HmoA